MNTALMMIVLSVNGNGNCPPQASPPQGPPVRTFGYKKTEPKNKVKVCNCSSGCVCGCNEGLPCQCDKGYEMRKATINPYYGYPYVAPAAGIPGGARIKSIEYPARPAMGNGFGIRVLSGNCGSGG